MQFNPETWPPPDLGLEPDADSDDLPAEWGRLVAAIYVAIVAAALVIGGAVLLWLLCEAIVRA